MNETITSTMGERIADLIKDHKTTQYDVAKAIKVSQPTLSAIINGEREKMQTSTLIKICDYFNVSADYILGRRDTPINITPDMEKTIEYLAGRENIIKHIIRCFEKVVESHEEVSKIQKNYEECKTLLCGLYRMI